MGLQPSSTRTPVRPRPQLVRARKNGADALGTVTVPCRSAPCAIVFDEPECSGRFSRGLAKPNQKAFWWTTRRATSDGRVPVVEVLGLGCHSGEAQPALLPLLSLSTALYSRVRADAFRVACPQQTTARRRSRAHVMGSTAPATAASIPCMCEESTTHRRRSAPASPASSAAALYRHQP